MTEFAMTGGKLAVQSASAAASLSMADANFDGVKHHDPDTISTGGRLLTWLVGIAAALGIASGLAAIYIEEFSLWVLMAFGFPLITGPAVLIQRRRLQWLPTFQEESNKLRMSVNELSLERNRLAIENGRLERQCNRLSAVEQRFEQVVKREKRDVTTFRQLVRENAAIQAELKTTQATKDLLDLFSVILRADKDEDNHVGDSEVNEFILRVRAFAGKRGKKFNEDALRSAFKQSMSKRGTASLFNLASNVLEEKEPQADEDDGFVKLQKLPRLSSTGLVITEDPVAGAIV